MSDLFKGGYGDDPAQVMGSFSVNEMVGERAIARPLLEQLKQVF
jgi:hypothetical protein